MIPLLENKRLEYATVRSVSEGTSSVQNIIAVITTVILAVMGDIIAFSVLPVCAGVCTRMVVCMAVVYCWPAQWFALVGVSIVATVNYQAGGEELLLGAITMVVLWYAKMRMVNTDFSRRVLMLSGYSALECMSSLLVAVVTPGVMLWRIAIVAALFFLYTSKAG